MTEGCSSHHDNKHLDITFFDHSTHRRSLISFDSSRSRSRSRSAYSEHRTSVPTDEENPPPRHPPPAGPPISRFSVADPHPGPPRRATTWASVKGCYCRNPRSWSVIVGLLVIAVILAVVLPLYLTAETRLKRGIEQASSAWAARPSSAIATTSLSTPSPTLESRNAPLSCADSHARHPGGPARLESGSNT